MTRGKINPLVGAAGISAFPMSGRLVQKIAQEEDFTNHVLMHAMGANTAGQLGSVIAGGILLALVILLANNGRTSGMLRAVQPLAGSSKGSA